MCAGRRLKHGVSCVFHSEKLYRIRKGQGRAFARPWPCVGGFCVRKQCVPLYTQWKYPHECRSGSYTSAMIFARYTPEERRISCASAALPAPPALSHENIVPGARPGLYVFLQHNGQTCTLHSTQSAVGEFTRSIFQVVTIALVLSWFATVIVIPYLGYKILPDHVAHDPNELNTASLIV